MLINHNSYRHNFWGVQFYVFILPYLYTSIHPPHLLMNMFAISVKTNFSENISQVSSWGEQPKLNFSEGGIMFILLFGISCLLIVFVFLKPLHYVHINLSQVSLQTNYI